MVTSEISTRIYFSIMNNHNFIYDGNELLAFGDNQYGQLGLGDEKSRNIPTLVGTFDNIILINGTIIKKIKWNSDIYSTLYKTKRSEIKNFLLVCHCYKRTYRINMVKYMRYMIISLLF